MALAASRWPASVRRCTSVSPERSLPASRLSETVRTAMFTGMKGRDGSIPGILHHRARIGIGRFVARPVAGRHPLQRGRLLAEPEPVYPDVGQHLLDEIGRAHV